MRSSQQGARLRLRGGARQGGADGCPNFAQVLETRRVVVTGIGAVTPLGNTREEFWTQLIAGTSGIARITAFDPSDLPTQIAGEVKDFDADALIGKKEARRMDRYAQFALVAADEAISDAALDLDAATKDRVGVIIGTGIGGIATLEAAAKKVVAEGNPSRISPFFIPMLMANAASAHVSMKYGFRGPLFSISSACATGNDAIVTAYNQVRFGDAPIVVTGGAEATVTSLAVGGFCSMKAMSTRNDDPAKASRPFDAQRDGFVLAEGAGILVLEEYERARARGARIYCEMIGYGQSADAYNIVAVDPEANGVEYALRRAFEHCGIGPEDVDYINAHGTSTPIGDPAESKGIERVFGAHASKVAVSSTKSMHGHALGAAGGLEGVATVLSVQNDTIPPTINYEFPDPACRLDYVPNVARRASVNIAISNSFGFGGHNSVIVFKKLS